MSQKPIVKENVSAKKDGIQNSENQKTLLFTKKQYHLMALGLGVIFIGYLLMMGTNNIVEGANFPSEDVYSARRIILAPIIIIAGFLIELYAIISVKKTN